MRKTEAEHAEALSEFALFVHFVYKSQFSQEELHGVSYILRMASRLFFLRKRNGMSKLSAGRGRCCSKTCIINEIIINTCSHAAHT